MTLLSFFVGTFSGVLFAIFLMGLTRASAAGSEESSLRVQDI